MTDPAIDPLSACIVAISGIEKPRAAALIDETTCIGCALCIQACPVDAIVGAAGQMHTVVAAWCTGCELCLPPCPVDCILMVPLLKPAEDQRVAADQARRRYEVHLTRKAGEQRGKAELLAAKTVALRLQAAAEIRQALITAAMARARRLNAKS